MKSELIVNVQSDEIAIALTEEDRLMEVNVESKTEATFAVGNVYYGRVKKVMPALNAVFVDVGYEKEAFLHYLDLGPEFLTLEKFTQFAVQDKNRKPLIQKTPRQKEVGKQGSIAEVCHVGQEILVQVTKEPINTKGPRLTAEISLAGRNIVLIPFGDKVMVSNKIKSEAERKRLKQMVQAIKPERFGVIVRTVAEGKRAVEIDAEMRLLMKRWDDLVAKLQHTKPVGLVAEEIGRTIGVIRDIFTPDFSAIHVNDPATYEEIRAYVSLISPESEKNVHLYEDAQPIFDHFQITRQMKTGLGRTVGFKNGGYLIMERTEALFSIDVNSGSKKLGADQEANAFNCNMLAADEIYHQLRLRDIGGIIIVDFIDMDSAEHRQQLFDHMRQLMKRDRARHNVLQLSKFGLMQITRQRVRPVVEVDVTEECPNCHGKGRIEPSLLFTEVLDEQIELYKAHFGRGLRLYVHPFVYAYASQGFFLTNLKAKWRRRYGIRLYADESMAYLSYRFINKDGKEVTMPKILEESVEKKADKKAALYATKSIDEKPEVKQSVKQEPAKNEPAKNEQQPESKTAEPEPTPAAPKASKPKRKRSKKKPAQEVVADVQPEVVVPQPEPVEQAAQPTDVEVAEKPKKKRSTRKKAAIEPEVQETVRPEVAPAEVKADEEEKPKRKRSTRKKAAPADVTPVVEEVKAEDAPVAKPAKPKKKKPAKKEVSKEEVAEVKATEESKEPSKPKRKRASKKKTTVSHEQGEPQTLPGDSGENDPNKQKA